MTDSEIIALFEEASEFIENNPELSRRVDLGIKELTVRLAAQKTQVEWRWVDDATQEALLIQPEAVRLSVEHVIFNDGSIGWWAKYKNSRINAYTTEEEAKAAALRTAETIKKSTWGQK